MAATHLQTGAGTAYKVMHTVDVEMLQIVQMAAQVQVHPVALQQRLHEPLQLREPAVVWAIQCAPLMQASKT